MPSALSHRPVTLCMLLRPLEPDSLSVEAAAPEHATSHRANRNDYAAQDQHRTDHSCSGDNPKFENRCLAGLNRLVLDLGRRPASKNICRLKMMACVLEIPHAILSNAVQP